MYLESKDVLTQPADEVYRLVRDDLPKIVPYLPNVDRIEVVSRSVEGDVTKIVNKWHAKADVPSALKKVLKPDLFSWKDTAVWKDKEQKVDYVLSNELFEAKGTNFFICKGESKTELKIACEVEIFADKIPGVPTFIARKLISSLEGVIKMMIAPNLTSLAKGLTNYYAERKK